MSVDVAGHLIRAAELIEVARENLDHEHPADSASRSYYAMFHSATAILGTLGIERSSHHGLWGAFGEHIAAKDRMDRKFHRMGLFAFGVRAPSDYLPAPETTAKDAEQLIADALEFLAAAKKFVGAE